MGAIFDTAMEKFDEHWIKFATAAGFMAVGWLIGRYRAYKNWEKREFYERLNISLNSMQDGKLVIRTLSEKRCDEIFLNASAAKQVADSARLTTEQDPLLPLDKDDYWYYLNSVLNEISEQFAQGHIKKDLGQQVTCAKYLICLTSEVAGTLRMRKVRAMVIQESVLLKLPKEVPKMAAQSHSTRWTTLQQLAAMYQKEPHRFLTMEICL